MTSPTAATGHMPFAGHRTVAQVIAGERKLRPCRVCESIEYRACSFWGCPASRGAA